MVVLKTVCHKCGTKEVSKAEFLSLAGSQAFNDLQQKIKDNESVGGILLFEDGCPSCRRESIDAKLLSIKPPEKHFPLKVSCALS